MTGSCRKDWIDVRAATWEAISTKARAPADSGREITTGVPVSASSRIPSSSGAGREVDDQVVEAAPIDLGHHRLDRLADHRPAIDGGLIARIDVAERHHLEAVRIDRLQQPVDLLGHSA